MFCYQCQETARNTGCTVRGVCGKSESLANLMDLLIYSLRGLAHVDHKLIQNGKYYPEDAIFVMQGLFTTITNANWSEDVITALIDKAIAMRDKRKDELCALIGDKCAKCPDAVTFKISKDQYTDFATKVGVLKTENEDIRSLRETITIGLKGVGAYGDHAAMLGFQDDEVNKFIMEALSATIDDSLSADDLVAMVLKTGEHAVKVMAKLDEAHTSTYGNPEPTHVNIGVGTKPGILVSGHDLKDFEELLIQTEGKGVDIYTHSEMLPANYYPAFKKFKHFHGNYGSSWWHQLEDFENFNGAILMTTNCIVPLRKENTYLDRFFTTGMAGYPGATHIADRRDGKPKDFSPVIEAALKCQPPKEIETGEIVGGFAHATVLSLADKVIDAVKSGAIKRFVVMAGCDGRMPSRKYFTEVAEKLPKDTIILTAGCAKYRYIKLNLGDIGGIPRILDAGQCNDSYSLAVIALKLKEAFGLDDVNKLPLSFDLGWYEQKAVAVLLALLYLGFKNIQIGPTLPGFLSPAVAKVIIDTFGLKQTTNPDDDIAAMMAG
ncbi:MAG: hydroxylamine reductase [Candidatus Cloacimonetes bacterium]|jgi:hydroxylamine reductase|nr:hydroxylamine reductase [Candidatus Cloacimonadota bacterium]MDD2719662.1 hydroxylamine reductase [Candidatus Cloacimonadota bacterium]MDD3547928.1 hydroxylamine reductase [Candidatus Cloacimonadota bacterium]MDD4815484.1 hydroxylamine reductase [Candidatus Cloacimonadota bacterium]MDD5537106.1 hydroxylamine reductase [Candidatus Cloacimonadota bacterium]